MEALGIEVGKSCHHQVMRCSHRKWGNWSFSSEKWLVAQKLDSILYSLCPVAASGVSVFSKGLTMATMEEMLQGGGIGVEV